MHPSREKPHLTVFQGHSKSTPTFPLSFLNQTEQILRYVSGTLSLFWCFFEFSIGIQPGYEWLQPAVFGSAFLLMISQWMQAAGVVRVSIAVLLLIFGQWLTDSLLVQGSLILSQEGWEPVYTWGPVLTSAAFLSVIYPIASDITGFLRSRMKRSKQVSDELIVQIRSAKNARFKQSILVAVIGGMIAVVVDGIHDFWVLSTEDQTFHPILVCLFEVIGFLLLLQKLLGPIGATEKGSNKLRKDTIRITAWILLVCLSGVYALKDGHEHRFVGMGLWGILLFLFWQAVRYRRKAAADSTRMERNTG